MTIKDFIYINSIPTGNTMEYNTKILEYFGENTDIPMRSMSVKVARLTDVKIVEIKGNKVKVGKKWFYIERDITSSTYSQFVELESYLIDETSFLKKLNEVLAIYVRPRVWNWKRLRYEIEKWDNVKKQKNAELLLEMDANIALGLNVFFYQNAQSSIKTIKTYYLEKMTEIIDQTLK